MSSSGSKIPRRAARASQTIWRVVLALGLALCMALPALTPARADGPLIPGYTLQDGQRVPAPTGYIQSRQIAGEDFDYGALQEPQDLFRDPATGNLLIADTGNNRILMIDDAGELVMEIGGEEAGLNQPQGVFVDAQGSIWVADTGNGRVAMFDAQGKFVMQQNKPESPFLDNMDFTPSKLVVDRRGFMYVVTGSENNLGVLVIDGTERFRGFFGRTKIPFNLGRVIGRALASETQRKRMLRVQPAPMGNLFLDAQGFIYAVSPILRKDQIQRLNSVGTNVYGEVGTRTGAGKLWEKLLGNEGIVFGESEVNWSWNNAMRMSVPQTKGAQFMDLAVDDLGIVSVLDGRNSQIYQYDQSGNLLTIFGGPGLSAGYLSKPVSLVAGEKGLIYVLDSARGTIEIFRPTDLTRMIHQASFEYFNGDYENAAALWQEISQRNTNFALAHSGLGKSMMGQKRYAEAMQEYYYAENIYGYSAAFNEYRYLWMRERFHLLGLGVIGAVVGVSVAGSRVSSGFRRLLDWLRASKTRYGLYAVPVLLALAILSWMLGLSALSFHFRDRRPDEIRLLFESGKILLPWITWCVAAFGVGEIFYGESTFRRILIDSAWALWPVIVFTVPVNLLTNVLTLNEKTLWQVMWWVIWILTAWEFFKVVRDAHNFEFGQAVLVSLLSLVGIVAVWILLGLVYALSAEIFRFVGQIILEIYVHLY